MKKLMNYYINKFGYEVHRTGQSNTMLGALERCKKRGQNINSVIDVGASNGCWSEICMKFFQDANYLLIEAQEDHKFNLKKFKDSHSNVEFIMAAAGNRSGEIFFDNSALFGGLASEIPFENNSITVPVTTIDIEVNQRKLEPPFLIKLDTHGYEIPIIEGAIETIKNSNLIIIETYNYKLTSDSLRYFEISKYMEDLGFSSIEMVDLSRRKKDNSFWQMDTFFIPSESKEFSYVSYE